MAETKSAVPFFSICIPQYNRTSFLLEALSSLFGQTFEDFEICISDDCSTDGREKEAEELLAKSGRPFVYRRQERNLRYDGNLRASIALARGRYCFLLGNDDALASPTVLEQLHELLAAQAGIGVAIANYEEFASGRIFRRITAPGVLGSGPETAAGYFRNMSFVSGVVLEREAALRHATDRWNGSEMYQMFVGCRILSEGASLLGVDRVMVRQGIRISGERVDSYATRPKAKGWPVVEQKLPLNSLGRLVADAVSPYWPPRQKLSGTEGIFRQILLFPYVFWLVEYRRVQSWGYAAGVALGMRPRRLWKGVDLSWGGKFRLTFLYAGVTLCGLVIPIRLFDLLQKRLYALAKALK